MAARKEEQDIIVLCRSIDNPEFIQAAIQAFYLEHGECKLEPSFNKQQHNTFYISCPVIIERLGTIFSLIVLNCVFLENKYKEFNKMRIKNLSKFFKARIITAKWNKRSKCYTVPNDECDYNGRHAFGLIIFKCVFGNAKSCKSFVPMSLICAKFPIRLPSINTLTRLHGLPNIENVVIMRQYQLDNEVLVKWHNIVNVFAKNGKRKHCRVNTDNNMPASLSSGLFDDGRFKITLQIGVYKWPTKVYYWVTNKPGLVSDSVFTCTVTAKCNYHARDGFTLKRHEEKCTDQPEIKSRAKQYGRYSDPFQMLIEHGFVPDDFSPPQHFSVFDLETLDGTPPSELDYEQTVELKLVSIAVAHNIGNALESMYFQRENSHPSSAQRLVDSMMDYLVGLVTRRIAALPDCVEKSIERLEEDAATNRQIPFILRRTCLQQLKNLKRLTTFGFNSSRFDLKLIVPYLAHYAHARNLPPPAILKRGTAYFSVELAGVRFKGTFIFFLPHFIFFVKTY